MEKIRKEIRKIAISLLSKLYYVYKKISNPNVITNNPTDLYSPLIIFDFDGTLCDSLDVAVSVVNKFADEYGFDKITDIEKMRGMTPMENMKNLGVSKIKLPFIVRKIQKDLRKRIDELKPFSVMKEILKYLKKEKKASLLLLSSNNIDNVLYFLNKYNMNYFDVFCTKVSTFGKSEAIKNIIKKAKLDISRDKVYYIGDEERDIRACKKAKIPIISRAWGICSYKHLKNSNPEFLCSSPSELKEIFNRIL